MELTLHDHVTGTQVVFCGSEQELETKLRAELPWLSKVVREAGLDKLLYLLNKTQRFSGDLDGGMTPPTPIPLGKKEHLLEGAGVLYFPNLRVTLSKPVDRAKVSQAVFDALDDKSKHTLEKLAALAGYRPDHEKYHEKLLEQPQQYFMSSRFRKELHEKHGDAQALESGVRRAWEKVQEVARRLRMEGEELHVGPGAPLEALARTEVDLVALASDEDFQDLQKMALADIRVGEVLHPGDFYGGKRYSYDHVLPEEARKKGYGLVVIDSPGELEAGIYHSSKSGISTRVGTVGCTKEGEELIIDGSNVDQLHRGQKLGAAAYEAVMAHAKNVSGIKRVTGDTHSTLASKTHEFLAKKHGMAYKAKPRIGPNAKWKTKQEFDEAKTGPYDFKYQPYTYVLKNDLPLTKTEDEVEAATERLKQYAEYIEDRGSDPYEDTWGSIYRDIPFARGVPVEAMTAILLTNPEVAGHVFENKEVTDLRALEDVWSTKAQNQKYALNVAFHAGMSQHVFDRLWSNASDGQRLKLAYGISQTISHTAPKELSRIKLPVGAVFDAISASEPRYWPKLRTLFANRPLEEIQERLRSLPKERVAEMSLRGAFPKEYEQAIASEYVTPDTVAELPAVLTLGIEKDTALSVLKRFAENTPSDRRARAKMPHFVFDSFFVPYSSDPTIAKTAADVALSLLHTNPDAKSAIESMLWDSFGGDSVFDHLYQKGGDVRDFALKNAYVHVLSPSKARLVLEHRKRQEPLSHPDDRHQEEAEQGRIERYLDKWNLDETFSQPDEIGWADSYDLGSFDEQPSPENPDISWSDHYDSTIPKELRKVSFAVGVNKLRKLRDAIRATGKPAVSPKNLMPGDWSKFRDKAGNISADAIQAHIDSARSHQFNLYHRGWTKELQRHSREHQYVTGFAPTNQALQQIEQEGLWGLYSSFVRKGKQDAEEPHPHHRSGVGLGWVRWTGDEKGVHVDEIQTDMDFDHKDPAHVKLKQILFGNNHPTEAMHEGFLQHLRDRGWHETPVHIWDVQPKAKIAQQRMNETLPAHMYQTYLHSPKKMGYDPSTYGTLDTQSGGTVDWQGETKDDLVGKPTHANKVRKFEEGLVKMAIADLRVGPRVKQSGAIEVYDYSHLLPEKSPFKLSVKHNWHTNTIDADVTGSSGDHIGGLNASVFEDDDGGGLSVEDASILPEHQNKGLGKALYEALYSHAYHKLGARKVVGSVHSSLASYVHRALARKHGLEYVASANVPSAAYPTEEKWQNAETGEWDRKYKQYSYTLKSEVNLELAQDMLGFSHSHHKLFEAARFMSSGRDPASLDRVRSAMWHHDGDPEAAALHAFGLEINEKNRKALRAVASMSRLNKADDETKLLHPRSIEAVFEEDEKVAEAVNRAYGAESIQDVHLHGKHSYGTILATDPATKVTYLLKPGGGPLVTSGANQERASQSRREVAFYGVAKFLGVHDFVPEAHLLKIDGVEVAALKMLPWSFKNLEKFGEKNFAFVQERLNHYRSEGTLHRWAVLDYLLANADRHGQNLMIDPEGRIRLIDHGSSFAGDAFAPSKDMNSFVPYYLRYTVASKFNTLDPKRKLAYMPLVSAEVERHIEHWVNSIDEKQLEQLLLHYGVDPQPVLNRLARLKAIPAPKVEGLNRLWITD